jgi:hypothetical protein
VRTEDLIVQLASSAGAVRPLPKPSARLARWTAGAISLIALGVLVIGPREDVLTAIRQPTFVVLALVTFSTVLLAAASAFALSVPGDERAPVYRATALFAGSAWAFMLIVRLLDGGDLARRVLPLPIHALCVIEIAGLGFVPAWALVAMLRRAAPLRPAWSGALAALAAAALGAAGTQLLCPIDDPAHQLVGHLLPVILLALAGTIAGRRAFDWLRRPPVPMP